MIINLTATEWDAVLSAFALADCEWEDAEESSTTLSDVRQAMTRRKAIERAQTKIHQLAP